MSRHVVFYHAHCTDGYGAAFSAWLKLGDDAEYVPCSYGEPNPKPAAYAGKIAHILDFSFPHETMLDIFDQAERVVWLDHHRTAFEMHCPGEYDRWEEDTYERYVLLDNNKSGALLAWEFYCAEYNVADLIRAIDDRDRWQFKLPYSREIHAGLQSMQPWSFGQWKGFTHLVHNGNYSEVLSRGQTVVHQDRQQRDSVRNAAQPCEVFLLEFQDGNVSGGVNRPGLALNSPLHMSELGNELAQKSGTYGLIWYMAENGRAKCSFRSIGDYDVSRIAKQYGGGGHKNAAGCEVSMEKLLEWLK